MTEILPHYFINSSHNTYIIGDQISGPVSYCGYLLHTNLIGAGCLEIDPVFVEGNDVAITHAYIPRITINYIRLSKVLQIITNFCEKNYGSMKGPIILSFDNKTIKKDTEQQIVWNVLNTHLFGEQHKTKPWYYPYNKPVVDGNNVTLESLRGKILIKWDQCDALSPSGTCLRDKTFDVSGISENEDAPSDKQKDETYGRYVSGKGLIPPPELKLTITPTNIDSKVIRVYNKNNAKWVHFTKTNYPLTKQKVNNTVAGEMMSIQYNEKLFIERNDIIIHSTHKNFIRVFPKGTELLSNNYPNVICWQNGCQMVAINMQKQDRFYHINQEFFRDGPYRLKQPWLLYDVPYPKNFDVTLQLKFAPEVNIDFSKIVVFYPPTYKKYIVSKDGTYKFTNVNPTTIIFYFVVVIEKSSGITILNKAFAQSKQFVFKGAKEIPFVSSYKDNKLNYQTTQTGVTAMKIFGWNRNNYTDPAIEKNHPYCYDKKINKYTEITDEQLRKGTEVVPKNMTYSVDFNINYIVKSL